MREMDHLQALGYMLCALKDLGYNKKEAKEIFQQMYMNFDLYTEEEAKRIGFEWYRNLKE